MIRVGVSSQHKYSDQIKGILCETVAERRYGKEDGGHGIQGESMMKVMKDTKVVGCTCLSVGKEVLLREKKFDVVIVDEAGQVSEWW